MRFLAALAVGLLLFAVDASAAPPACNAGAEGTIVYNKDQKLVQFCNGTSWIGMVAKIGGTGDTLGELSCQQDEVPVWNGSAWDCGVGGGDSLWTDSGNGYLTYTGTDVGIKIQSITGMSAPKNTLADLGCANNEILKWDGDSWECAADGAGTLPGLNSAQIWVGNGSNAATAVTMSGDATLSNAGVLTIGSNAVGSAEITNASIALADLSATGTASATTYLRGDNTWATISSGLPALSSASIWVGNASNAATAVAMSGDATLSNAGVLTIANNAIGSAEITNASIALADLSATGTASATTYLRGDNTWATIAAGDAPTLDGLDSAQFLRSDADDLTTGRLISTGALAASQVMATATGGFGAFEARSQGSGATAGAAFIAFHRPSAYAAYFGIDTDNQLKFGGWSAGANSHKVWHAGNDGAASGLDADTLDGQDSAYFTSATNLASGTVPAARMPALTGDVTATAGTTATTIANNAVTSAKIADGAVALADLAGNSVNSAKIADGSVTEADTSFVGALTESKWCTVASGKIVCTSDAPGGGGAPSGTVCGMATRSGSSSCSTTSGWTLVAGCEGVSFHNAGACPSGYTKRIWETGEGEGTVTPMYCAAACIKN